MAYQPEFLDRVWRTICRDRTGRGRVDPDAFIRWTYARALAHREPRYAAMAKWGVTVTADEVAAVGCEADFIALSGRERAPLSGLTGLRCRRVCLFADGPQKDHGMPIKIPADLPAYDVLTREGVMVMSEDQASQDIRPLRIGLLNLMPKKIQTENQFARLIGATPLQIELSASSA